jgi:hypothetical protein
MCAEITPVCLSWQINLEACHRDNCLSPRQCSQTDQNQIGSLSVPLQTVRKIRPRLSKRANVKKQNSKQFTVITSVWQLRRNLGGHEVSSVFSRRTLQIVVLSVIVFHH